MDMGTPESPHWAASTTYCILYQASPGHWSSSKARPCCTSLLIRTSTWAQIDPTNHDQIHHSTYNQIRGWISSHTRTITLITANLASALSATYIGAVHHGRFSPLRRRRCTDQPTKAEEKPHVDCNIMLLHKATAICTDNRTQNVALCNALKGIQ